MEQWFLRITAYQDQLLDDMAQLAAWPERVLVQQKNWVGKSHGAEVDFPVEGCEPIRVFTTRIDTICGRDLHGPRPGAPDGRRPRSRGRRTRRRARTQIARLRSQDRRARLEGRVEKEGVFTGRYATNPFTNEKIPVWVGQLRAHGLRHRRHHVRPRPRPARLRVRPQVRARGAGRHPAGGRAPRRRHDAGRVRRRRPRRQQRALRRHDGRRGHPEDGRLGAGRRASARPRSRTASRTGSSAASATGARRSRSSTARRTACSRCPTTELPIVLPPDAPFTGEGGNPLEKVPAFVSATCPRCGGQGPARDGHHGHLRGLVLVLLPLPLAAEGRRPVRPRGRASTGSRSTSTSAASSTRSCTSSTRASGRRSCATSASSRSTSRSRGSSRRGWCTRTAR